MRNHDIHLSLVLVQMKTIKVHMMNKSQKKKKELNLNALYCYFAILARLTTFQVCLFSKISIVELKFVFFGYFPVKET